MKNKKLIILFLITLAVILTAGITAKMRAPQSSVETIPLFPDLTNRINDVAKIVIEGDEKTVELSQQGEIWVITTTDNYPALFNKVRAAVINLTSFKIVNEKTDNPELYNRLGVEDPAVEDATSLLITLFDEKDQKIVSLIVGNPRQSSGSKPGLYVRKPDEKTALLVEGVLDISANQTDWFHRDLFDIPSDRVSSVKINFADGNAFEIYKEAPEQTDFEVHGENIANESASKIIINRLGNSMQEMRADGVIAAGNFSFPDDAVTTTVTTFDGLVINAKLAQVDDKSYVNFTFTTDPEKLSADKETAANETGTNAEAAISEVNITELAQTLDHALSGWVYLIPDFKYEALTTSPDSLINMLKALPEGQSIPNK